MEKLKLKLQRKTAFEFKSNSTAEGMKSLGHPTTTTTRPTITFTCKV